MVIGPLIVLLVAPVALAAPPLTERLEKWKREIEQRGGEVVVARIETDRETNQIRIPPDTPRRVALARFLTDREFVERFHRTHAMTVNYQAQDAKVHFILLNMARSAEFKDAEESLLGHEFGHAWLDAQGFRSLDYSEDEQPCLAIHASDIVQHLLIRRELDSRGIPFRPYWTRTLDQALDALKKGSAPAGDAACDALARIALWTDVKLGLNAESWRRYGEFDAAFRGGFPALTATVDELVTVLKAVDVTARDRYSRALAYVRRRLAVTAGLEPGPTASGQTSSR